MKRALQEEGIAFELNEGDGAFYGPKIDINVKDAIGRFHQCATIQLDFQMPQSLGAEYVTPENSLATPVMIHRALLGSIERFIGVLIEHCAGHFPIGLSPVQARILNVTDDEIPFSQEVETHLKACGVRVETDFAAEKLGYKIRNAQLLKIPYMLVVGPKEAESKMVTARFWDGTQLEPMSVQAFAEKIKAESKVFWGLDVNQK